MSEISCKYCGRDGMDKHQNLVHVCDRATVEQRYDEADARIASLEAQLAAAQEREEALRAGFTACIDTLWRYARIAARERGESETSQLMSANEAVGHFRAALNAAKGE